LQPQFKRFLDVRNWKEKSRDSSALETKDDDDDDDDNNNNNSKKLLSS
jgi:hypothetical protein